MKIARFQFNMFGESCYVVWSPQTRECMIVDPGMISTAENEVLDAFIAREQLTVKYLVNTHLHLDHCFGNAHVCCRYGIKAMAHPADFPLGRSLRQQARLFGINNADIADLPEPEPLTEGTMLTLGDERIEVRHVPGHSPGGITLYAPADGWAIVGDSLFSGGIGRTDLAGGDYQQLINSITNQLLTLPDLTQVLPGHGPSTTIAREKSAIPYL